MRDATRVPHPSLPVRRCARCPSGLPVWMVPPTLAPMTMRPVEWEIRHPTTGDLIAIVRVVALGARHDWYARAVTPEGDRTLRTLIGYWASPDEAHRGVLALFERRTGRSLAAGGTGAPTVPLVPMKPPPGTPDEPREAARRRDRASRA